MKSKRTSQQTDAVPAQQRKPESNISAREHYRREKARRAQRGALETPAMAAARREYLALLEADAAKGRGGRPKKKRESGEGTDNEAGLEDEPAEE